MVVHENPKNAVFDIIRAIFSDYESGGSKFESWRVYLQKAPNSYQSQVLFLCPDVINQIDTLFLRRHAPRFKFCRVHHTKPCLNQIRRCYSVFLKKYSQGEKFTSST